MVDTGTCDSGATQATLILGLQNAVNTAKFATFVKANSCNKRRTQQDSVVVTHYTCVLEVYGSKLEPGTDNPEVFRNFLQLLQATG
jgi:hypothetical protein